MTGLKVQPSSGDGRSNATILQTVAHGLAALVDIMDPVRQQFDEQNWRCRPKPARRNSPKPPDAQPRLFPFRIYEDAMWD